MCGGSASSTTSRRSSSSDETREREAEVADRTRRERALVGLHERFAAAVDRTVVEIRVAGVGLLRGLVTGSGPDWVLLDHRVEAALSVVPARVREPLAWTGRCWWPRTPSVR